MSATASPIDRIRELGGELFLRGDVIRYRIPADSAEARQLLAEIRKDREAVITLLRDRESKPPSSAPHFRRAHVAQWSPAFTEPPQASTYQPCTKVAGHAPRGDLEDRSDN